MMSLSPTQAAFTFIIIWLISLIKRWRSALNDIGDCPGRGALVIHPFGGLSMVFDRWFPLKLRFHHYYAKFSLFAHYGSTCLSSFNIWSANRVYWLSDPAAIKKILDEKASFQKDFPAFAGVLDFYGASNIVMAEGSQWKNHRYITRQMFNEENNAFVWYEATRVYSLWRAATDNTGASEVPVDLVRDMLKITIRTIGSAGFGQRASWTTTSGNGLEQGQHMPLIDAAELALEMVLPRSLIPEWLLDLGHWIHIPILGPTLRAIRRSYADVKFGLLEIVSNARTQILDGKAATLDAALLKNMVEANMAASAGEEDVRQLTDNELLSNSLIFLLAGAETVAHTLSFMVALLALYPDVQHKIHEEVRQLFVAEGSSFVRLFEDRLRFPVINSRLLAQLYKEHMHKLVYTTAAFYEASRLFTIVSRLGRVALKDTTTTAKRFKTASDGAICDIEDFPVVIKKGSNIIIDVSAVHMNPMHWGNDVNEFKPERFIDTESYRWPRDAFLAFSAGHRSCPGQRFAFTEAVCVIANLVRDYEILVPSDLRFKSSIEQRKILDWNTWLTTVPINARVSLRRRSCDSFFPC